MPKTLSEDLGLVLADSVSRLLADAAQLAQGGAEVSLERLGEIDADILFIPVYAGSDGTPDRSGIEALAERSLWSTLPAVQAGEVYEFTGDITYESGPMAMAFLDVVEESLLG
jgi:ABC-type Fe3+-hydroxamate transport system substrate-binding protein